MSVMNIESSPQRLVVVAAEVAEDLVKVTRNPASLLVGDGFEKLNDAFVRAANWTESFSHNPQFQKGLALYKDELKKRVEVQKEANRDGVWAASGFATGLGLMCGVLILTSGPF